MKKLLLLLPFLFIKAVSQNTNEPCATMPLYYHHINNPDSKNKYTVAESKSRQWLSNSSNKTSAGKLNSTIIKIPVVVHVVYKNATQNIADSMIYSQLIVLNECFRKQNSNFNTTRTLFDTIGTDTEIEFCLANFDPNGNPTSGIIRKQAPAGSSFDPILNNDKVKKPTFGGDTAWPASKYLNIWITDMSIFGQTFVLGYATFPGANPALDGVVIQYNYFGKYANPGFLGRTTVHEVGHWLGLRHIWADDDNGQNAQAVYCDSTDFVDDTPNAGPKSQSDCDKTKNTCTLDAVYWGGVSPPDMIENYMDYSSDDCMTLFTKGQKARMYSFLNSNPERMAIKTSTAGCNVISSIISRDFFNSLVEVFPVPANDILNIKLKASFSNTIDIMIFNTEGKLILRKSTSEQDPKLNIQHLPNGIYSVRIQNEDNFALKKLIIAR